MANKPESVMYEIARDFYPQKDTEQIWWRLANDGFIELIVAFRDTAEMAPMGLPLARSGFLFRSSAVGVSDVDAFMSRFDVPTFKLADKPKAK